MDQILVLGKHSEIVEEGSHDTLLAKNREHAMYRKMHLGEEPQTDNGASSRRDPSFSSSYDS